MNAVSQMRGIKQFCSSCGFEKLVINNLIADTIHDVVTITETNKVVFLFCSESAEPLGYNPKIWRQLAWVAIILLTLAVVATIFRHRLGILALFCRHRLVQPDFHGKEFFK